MQALQNMYHSAEEFYTKQSTYVYNACHAEAQKWGVSEKTFGRAVQVVKSTPVTLFIAAANWPVLLAAGAAVAGLAIMKSEHLSRDRQVTLTLGAGVYCAVKTAVYALGILLKSPIGFPLYAGLTAALLCLTNRLANGQSINPQEIFKEWFPQGGHRLGSNLSVAPVSKAPSAPSAPIALGNGNDSDDKVQTTN